MVLDSLNSETPNIKDLTIEDDRELSDFEKPILTKEEWQSLINNLNYLCHTDPKNWTNVAEVAACLTVAQKSFHQESWWDNEEIFQGLIGMLNVRVRANSDPTMFYREPGESFSADTLLFACNIKLAFPEKSEQIRQILFKHSQFMKEMKDELNKQRTSQHLNFLYRGRALKILFPNENDFNQVFDIPQNLHEHYQLLILERLTDINSTSSLPIFLLSEYRVLYPDQFKNLIKKVDSRVLYQNIRDEIDKLTKEENDYTDNALAYEIISAQDIAVDDEHGLVIAKYQRMEGNEVTPPLPETRNF